MTADSIEASSLDAETLMLVRIAALAAVDAPAVSYLLNLGAASEVGVDAEQVRGVLAAIAPIVGTARVASATGQDRRARSRSRSRSQSSRTSRTSSNPRRAAAPPREGRLTLAARHPSGAPPIEGGNEMLWTSCSQCLDRDRVLAGPRRRPEGAQLLPVLPLQPGLLPARAARRLHGRRSNLALGLTGD